jgi:predicted ABC-type ATPase
MLVVAGPPGGGKTTYFPVSAVGFDAFNIDDRCAQILGSYRGISRDVRRAVATECEHFVLDHIDQGRSFAVETTLRTTAALEQAKLARAVGFATELRFIATEAIEENVSRVMQRAQGRVTARRSVTSARSTWRASRTCQRRSRCSSEFGSTTRPSDGPHRASSVSPATGY